ncbi:GGDEF domain-containing protein [Parerythrobacter lacustris]|uniref:diguanylate cyclase n=1 Tax=Parerythrobacter lacustris TaxID=2969984 RepID=A0ABT1XMS9_9SPHN|nr:GGDEF domain-containing protein [Parerythrobacter lacustris]MCR2832887.1 GGDEF domain-containing protein [Parerythrobacter lacustris]
MDRTHSDQATSHLPRAAGPGGQRRALRRRLWRNGFIVVGASIAASVMLVQLAFSSSGEPDYTTTMLFAVLIPLVVASCAYLWIASLTVRLERSRAELETLALTDPLTGLANRRAAMRTMQQWSGSEESGQRGAHDPARRGNLLSVAIADIDRFKRINDQFGHDAGDAGIVHVAHILSRLAPEGWLVARLGGEEFLIAAPTAGGGSFSDLVERVRTTLETTPLITHAGQHRLTASFGVATLRGDEAIDRLMIRADRALYDAKETGRNRSVIAA